jgi:ketosteroid isomerase-like protein
MYKAAVRWMIRKNIGALNAGNYEPALQMFAADATLTFPGDNSWSRQFSEPQIGRRNTPTHRGRQQIEAFLQRYVDHGLQMQIEDVLVNGPPWNMRAVAIVTDWAVIDGEEVYSNRAALYVRGRWGKIVSQEDYEDTTRPPLLDAYMAQKTAVVSS